MTPILLLFCISGLVHVNCQDPVAPYITFRGRILPNNSYIELSEIGRNISNGVQCHTDLTTCCDASYGPHRGHWYSPYAGEDLSNENSFGQGLVSLHNHTTLRFGVYRCEIDTSASIHSGENDTAPGPRETVYAGLFYKYRGQGNLHVRMRISVHDTQPLQFTLTCTSAFGPATTVIWMRDSEVVEGGMSVLTNSLTPTYRHTLTASEEGVYTCTVSNNLPSTATATLNITRPSPPSNLSVSQNGPNSVLVSWVPSDGAESYTIYYQSDGGRRLSRQAETDDTSFTLFPLSGGKTYSISIVANTALHSTEVGPVNVTIDSLLIRVYRSSFLLYPGQVVKLTCSITLLGTLTGTPIFSWEGPVLLPTPIVSAPSEQVVTSDLVFNSINSSHVGRYTCTARLDNFPFSAQDYTSIGINYKFRLSVSLRIEIHHTQPLQFTLTCISSRGVPTYVTWMRDLEVIEGGMTVLEDYKRYIHTLNATEEGVYNCTVSNDRPDSATAMLNVTRPSPPSNLSVSQNGLKSALVSWAPSDGAEGYLIYYRQDRFPLRAGANDTSISLSHLSIRRRYSISIVAYTALRSAEVGPVNFTLDSLTIWVTDSSPVVGRQYSLYCFVTLHGNLTGTPIFSWQGPGVLPTPVTPSWDITTSRLTFHPLRLSDRGEYTCTVRLENFPYSIQQSFDVHPIYLSPAPRTSVITSHSPPFFAGTILNLTCNIPLNAAVDLPVVERIRWVVDNVVLDSSVSSDRISFSERSIVFLPLNLSDSASYRCDVHFEANAGFINYAYYELDLNVDAPPPPEVEITAASTAIAGTALTLECSVSVVPHLTTPPHVEMTGPGEVVLASGTGLSLTHTLDPVLASDAGQQYVCKTVLEIESLGVSLESQSAAYTLTVLIPRPSVTISANPPDILVTGSSVTLTCVATLDPHVDAFGSVFISWGGPRLINGELYSVKVSSSGLSYTSNFTVSDVKKRDEGEYTCTARVSGGSNILGTTITESIPVSVLVPIPTVSISANPPGILNITSSLTLICEATFDVEMEVLQNLSISFLWGGRRAISGDETYSVEESGSGLTYTSNLTVSDVEKRDEGEYTCTVKVSGGGNVLIDVTEYIFVSVLDPPPPEVEITAASTAIAGTALTLECSVSVVPHLTTPPRVELTGPGEVVLASGTGLSLTHTLDPVLASNAGQYVCKTTVEVEGLDEPLQSQSYIHTLTVQIPRPTVTISANQLGILNTSSSVTFTCEATLDPSVNVVGSVTFLWGGPRLISGDKLYLIKESGFGLSYTSNLTVSDVEKRDEGEYTCTARVSGSSNILGTTITESIHVSVLVPKPTVTITANPPGVLDISSSVILICEATLHSRVDPLQSISLTWGGSRVINGDEAYLITGSDSGLRYTSSLAISDVEKEDEGEYTCTLNISEGGNGFSTTITESISVNVVQEPKPSKENSSAAVQTSVLSVIMTGVMAIFSSL